MTRAHHCQRAWYSAPPRNGEKRQKCFTLVAPVRHKEAVLVWRSPLATAHPYASTVNVCQDGAVHRPANKLMTNTPKDDTIKAALARSSSTTV